MRHAIPNIASLPRAASEGEHADLKNTLVVEVGVDELVEISWPLVVVLSASKPKHTLVAVMWQARQQTTTIAACIVCRCNLDGAHEGLCVRVHVYIEGGERGGSLITPLPVFVFPTSLAMGEKRSFSNLAK